MKRTFKLKKDCGMSVHPPSQSRIFTHTHTVTMVFRTQYDYLRVKGCPLRDFFVSF